jgi:hypothetical protein
LVVNLIIVPNDDFVSTLGCFASASRAWSRTQASCETMLIWFRPF